MILGIDWDSMTRREILSAVVLLASCKGNTTVNQLIHWVLVRMTSINPIETLTVIPEASALTPHQQRQVMPMKGVAIPVPAIRVVLIHVAVIHVVVIRVVVIRVAVIHVAAIHVAVIQTVARNAMRFACKTVGTAVRSTMTTANATGLNCAVTGQPARCSAINP